MKREYRVEKKNFKIEDIEYLVLYFDDGDVVWIFNEDIEKFKLKFYDRLVFGEQGYCPFVESGEIVFDIKKRIYCEDDDSYDEDGEWDDENEWDEDGLDEEWDETLDNPSDTEARSDGKSAEDGVNFEEDISDDFRYPSSSCRHDGTYIGDMESNLADMRAFIKKRFFSVGSIVKISVNCDDFHLLVFGNIVAEERGEKIVLRFFPKAKYEPSDGDEYTVETEDVDPEDLHRIGLVFENCDDFTVYSREIVNLKLEMKDRLVQWSEEYIRMVDSGYMTVKVDNHGLKSRYGIDGREIDFSGRYTARTYRQILKERLLGNRKKQVHIICCLALGYFQNGKGSEYVAIDEIKSDEEVEYLIEKEDNDCHQHYFFEGGYCENLGKGRIGISFGKEKGQNKN